jgi:acyl carrier protein
MDTSASLEQDIKQLIVENLMLQITTDEIGDDQALFGPGSLGLDSVDALQLVVALDKKFGLKIQDPEAARQVLESVKTITAAVTKHKPCSSTPGRASGGSA